MKIFLLSILLFGIMNAKKVPVYYLNADYDYRNMMDWSKPDIDCLHTVGDPIPFPEKVTVCVRNMHMTYSNPVSSSYAHAFGFGTYLDDWTELKEGISNNNKSICWPRHKASIIKFNLYKIK